MYLQQAVNEDLLAGKFNSDLFGPLDLLSPDGDYIYLLSIEFKLALCKFCPCD